MFFKSKSHHTSSRGKRSRSSGSSSGYKKPLIENYKLLSIWAAGILVVGALAYRPLDRYYDKVRYNKAILHANEALQKHKVADVETQIIRAWNVSRKSITELREIFSIAKKIRSGQMLPLTEAIVTSPEATIDDITDSFSTLSTLRSPKLYQKLYAQLPPATQQNKQIRYSHICFLAMNDRLAEAIPLTEDLVKTEPDFPKAKLALIDLWLRSPNKEQYQNNAAESIRKLMANQNDKKTAIEAYRRITLLVNPLAHFRFMELEKWADDSGEPLVEERFFIKGLRVKEMFGGERDRYLDEVISTYKDKHPDTVARWLLFCNAQDKITQLPEAIVKTTPNAYTAYVETLFSQHVEQKKKILAHQLDPEKLPNYLEQAEALLATPPPKVGDVFLETSRSIAAFLKGDNSKNFYHQERAFRAANFESTYQDFFTILSLSDKFGDTNTARQATLAISSFPTKALPETERLTYFDKYLVTEPEILSGIYRKLNASRPDDATAALKFATLLIIVEENPEEARKVITPWLTGTKMLSSFQTCMAMSYLAENNPAKALELLEKDQANLTSSNNDFDKAIYSTILLKKEEIALAEFMYRRVNWANILPSLNAYLLKLWGDKIPKEETPSATFSES